MNIFLKEDSPKRCSLAALTCIGLMTTMPAFAQAMPEPLPESDIIEVVKYDFNIAAQSLGEALLEFGMQSGLQVSVDTADVAGKDTSGVQGSMSLHDALDILLDGTGLQYRINGRMLSVTKILESEEDVINLAPVKLKGNRMQRPGQTEGSGSYTTPSMATATKLNLSPRETPQAITVMTRQRMDDQAMVDILDVVTNAPGLSMNSYGVGRPTFYARGFMIDNIIEDGIPTAFDSYIPSPLANLSMYDRVEVVRGSTGLTQGAGNPSAAINLLRKRPTVDFRAEVSTNIGSWNDLSLTGDVSGALNQDGTIRGRVVAYVQDGESFRDFEKENSQLFYATLDIDLSDNSLLNFGFSHFESDTNFVWGGMPLSVTTGTHLDLPRSTFVGADWEFLDQNMDTFFVSFDHNFSDDWSFHFNGKYVETYTDVLGTWLRPSSEVDGFSHGYWSGVNDFDQVGFDAHFSGNFELFGRSHKVVLGGTVNDENRDSIQFYGSRTGLLTEGVDLFTWQADSIPKPALGLDHPGRFTEEGSIIQNSLYGVSQFNLSNSLKAITGIRFDWYENIGRWSQTKEDGNPTIYGGLIYDLNTTYSVYASYTDIFTPQQEQDLNRQTLVPIVGENYEIGLKGAYYDGTLNGSIALFQVDQTNRAQQIADQTLSPYYPDHTSFEATGLVRSSGIDFEIQGAITQDWQLGFGYTYTRTEYRKDANPSNVGEQFDTGLPEHLFKLNTSYTLPGESGKWRVGASYSYQSEFYYDIDIGDAVVRNEQSGYGLLGMMVDFKATDNITIQANINNVLDKTYYRTIGDHYYWGANEAYGDPRNYTVTARYKW
ncbi:TonB-dependent receptor [Puniceicoccaceae bacterium K14]|nr:TonB-dependent receptor [Puniceicoccaceae bacterium K14]